MPSVHRKIKQRGRGPYPAGFLREREWARPAVASCWHETNKRLVLATPSTFEPEIRSTAAIARTCKKRRMRYARKYIGAQEECALFEE